MRLVSYVRLSSDPKPLDHWKSVLRKLGCPVGDAGRNDDMGPFYVEEGERTASRLEIDGLPILKAAVYALTTGDRLVVPDFGHFGHARVWNWVAVQAAKAGATVLDGKTGRIFDFKGEAAGAAATAAGADLTEQTVGKKRAQRAYKGRIATGHLGGAKKKLTGTRLERARALWVDPDYTIPEIVAELNDGAETKDRISDKTLRRAMTHKGEEMTRAAAIALHRQGKWT